VVQGHLPGAVVTLICLALVACGGSGEGADAATSGGADGSVRGSDDGSIPPGDATAPPQDAATAQGDAGQFTLSSLDEPCEGGPTGRQLLAYVESRYTGTYDHPDAGPTALTLTASYDSGAIECTPAPPFNCCPGCPCRTPPPPTVSVDLDVGFQTADGTLDESFVGTAVFSPDVYEVPWTATLPSATVKGTYAFAAGSTGLEFNGTFRSANTQGTIAEQGPTGAGSATPSGGTWMGTAVDAGAD